MGRSAFDCKKIIKYCSIILYATHYCMYVFPRLIVALVVHGREFLGTVMCFLSDSFFIFPMSFVAYIHRCPQGVGIAFSEVVLSIQLSQTDRVGRVQYTG